MFVQIILQSKSHSILKDSQSKSVRVYDSY